MNDFTATFTVDQTPEEVFAAINNVRGWWSGEIEGSTDKLGDVWTYRFQDIHYSKQEITEFVPGQRVVWHVLDGFLNFTEDKTEWTGTDIAFDSSPRRRSDGGPIHPPGSRSRIRVLRQLFKRVGLLHQGQLAGLHLHRSGAAQREGIRGDKETDQELSGSLLRWTHAGLRHFRQLGHLGSLPPIRTRSAHLVRRPAELRQRRNPGQHRGISNARAKRFASSWA